uniref:RNase H domain-containing protein n=1 Tax=Rhodnius prolixus TaxID=13249 RepID=T1HZL3_RHOPR
MVQELSGCPEGKLVTKIRSFWFWVPGYSVHKGNEAADLLAREGSAGHFVGFGVLFWGSQVCNETAAINLWVQSRSQEWWLASRNWTSVRPV